MLVAHVNGRCVKICANIKLPFFLHVPISPKKNSFNICGTRHGFNHGGFVVIFVDPTYLYIYDDEYDEEEANENCSKEPWVVNMCRLMRLDDTSPNVEEEKDHKLIFNFICPHKKTTCLNG